MIKLTLKLYLDNKNLLAGTDEDMEVGISNIINTDITETGMIVLAKSLNGQRRHKFIESIASSKFGGIERDKDTIALRSRKLRSDCKPWGELFKDIKRKKVKDIDKQIIEYEISNLYLKTINDNNGIDNKGFIKNVKLEIAW